MRYFSCASKLSTQVGGRWWIRTTEVIDDRFTVCSLWPLGKPPIYTFQNSLLRREWSWWTDLNPRPADYKSAALPTELHQHFLRFCLSQRLVYNITWSTLLSTGFSLFQKKSFIIISHHIDRIRYLLQNSKQRAGLFWISLADLVGRQREMM